MANHAIWNVRLRHEWLANKKKKHRVKARTLRRVSATAELERRAKAAEAPPAS